MRLIIEKYLAGRATETEMKALLEWLRHKENTFEFRRHKDEWKRNLDHGDLPSESRENWSRLQDQIAGKSFTSLQASKKSLRIFRIAAIFIFLVSLGTFSWFYSEWKIKPIDFHSHVLAENGQISKIILPDGTEVWLNSGSELSYSSSFAIDNREVKITGEGYFQVSPGNKLPLIVNCGNLQVKVLGTWFNVNAYPGSGFIDVVLEKGTVQLLRSGDKAWKYTMQPGERAKYTLASHNLKVDNVNVEKFTSWKEGIINIYNQTLEEVLERLELRYNQKFEFDPLIKGIRYTFTIKNESLDEIILLMEKITPIRAVQENNIIVFKPDNRKVKKAGG